ncbi:MAG: efflux transporter outer membrane subunit [Verrucomicrobiales bacterium]
MHRPAISSLMMLPILAAGGLWTPQVAAQSGVAVPARFAADPTGGAREAQLGAWWKTLGDPILDDLITDALANNRDLVVAEARVAEAVARRRAAAGEYWPQVGARLAAGRGQASESTRTGVFSGLTPSNEFLGTVTASWEIDVFGRIRQGVRAAQARAEAQEEGRRDVLVILLAEVAATYLDLRGLQAERGVIEANIKSQENTAELTRVRRDAGVDNALAVAQAEGQLAITKATLPPLVQLIREAQHRLATLTGQPPATYLQKLSAVRPLPRGPRQIPAGLPSTLLARRPDVRRAERLVAAAAAQVGQARAERLPVFALTAQTGQQSEEVGDLVERRSNLWSLGASLSIPLFTGGTLRENVRAAEAVFTQAKAGYEQSMLLALEEVETALVRLAESQKTLAALREAEAQALKTLTLSTDLYRNGAGSFLNVLEAQRSKLIAQAQAVSSERQVALNLVSLYKALGGGWDTPVGSSSPSPAINSGKSPTLTPDGEEAQVVPFGP